MKKWILLLMFLASVEVVAQEKESDPTWSVSYLGHIGFQPGLKLGLEMPLMGQATQVLPDEMRTWIIRPQVGYFTNPGDDQNWLINVEAGIRKPIAGKNAYRIFSFGLGYLNQSKMNSFSVNLGNGQTDNRQRVSDHFLLPTLNYEYGWATHRKVGWFTKVGLGRRSFGNHDSFMLFAELGIKFKFKNDKE